MATQVTTTHALIKARYAGTSNARGVLEQLLPALAQEVRFERARPRNRTLRQWADGKTSAQFRKFEWMRSGPAVEPFVLLPDVIMRMENATLTVAYPVLPGLYGTDDIDAMEDLIRSDARQIRDALLDPGNLVDGCCAVLPSIDIPEREETIWFQTFTCELTYYEGQTFSIFP